MGRLERKLDTDLIERIIANGPQSKKKPSEKKARIVEAFTPAVAGRTAKTYRGARRNALRARKLYIARSRRKEPTSEI